MKYFNGERLANHLFLAGVNLVYKSESTTTLFQDIKDDSVSPSHRSKRKISEILRDLVTL